ncbi:hypothetical protein [Bradyrhizobium ivorense]|uniref:hypothetical protein n=1 Tax=Bradyrhizobium ivorense TaxID=2511166 RepID=UPI001115F46A|nr:hypothetical protein [Bradyrhizobium ivorense]
MSFPRLPYLVLRWSIVEPSSIEGRLRFRQVPDRAHRRGSGRAADRTAAKDADQYASELCGLPMDEAMLRSIGIPPRRSLPENGLPIAITRAMIFRARQ